MFKVSDPDALQKQVSKAEYNYTIQINDHLKLDVFTNEGERIVDPNQESIKTSTEEQGRERPPIEYLVDKEGMAKFPMIGDLKVEGLTLRQAEEILQKEYAKYYQQPYVVLQYTNKRVIVLGSPGGQVIPLINQNVKLVEVLAMAKGIDNFGKAHNIRVLRGDQVFVADLSTVDGYLKNNMVIEPGDVVYVEPVRRPIIEGFRDYGPMLTILTSITTVLIVLTK
jgi:polysaccharide biosynthesis/export protein